MSVPGCACSGSKVTRTTLTRAGSGASSSGSCQTVPVNHSLRARTVEASAADLISMALVSIQTERCPALSRDANLGRGFEWASDPKRRGDQQFGRTQAADVQLIARKLGRS